MDSDDASQFTEGEMTVNNAIQNVFLITLDPRHLGQGSAELVVHLRNYADYKPIFDLENVVNPFFERMLMPASDLTRSVTRNSSRAAKQCYGRPDQSDVVMYLGECYIRLTAERLAPVYAGHDHLFQKLEEIIFQNLRLGFQEPDLFLPQNLPRQFYDFFIDRISQFPDQITAFTHKFLNASATDFEGTTAGMAILDVAYEKCKRFQLMSLDDSLVGILSLITTFSSSPNTAKILMLHSTPRNTRDAMGCELSLLGTLIRISCLPEHHDAPCQFFQNPTKLSQSEVSNTNSYIWSNIARISEAVFKIFNNVVRQSAELREMLLHWIGDSLSSNFGRAKMWQPSVQFQIRLASDGFILNLSAILLRLCRPFVNPPKNPKILKIHHLFTASGSYLRKLPEETTLQPKENTPVFDVPKEFNFITSCFFLTHESLRLSWALLWDRFTKYGRALHELEGQLEEARRVDNGVAVAQIENRLVQLGTRHLTILAALTLPDHMELMIEFAVCTATWLAQMAVQPETASLSDTVNRFYPLFPFPAKVPPHLQFVPEFLVESVTEVMSCYVRVLSRDMSIDWKHEWMEELMSLAVVYMSGHERMKNPHLRAKMAKLMHDLMPHTRFADTYQERNVSKMVELMDVMKERLFMNHEYRQEFFPAVMNVFVSIEMTGSNLRFGEAFHYRRPLYAIMEYLFTLEYHQKRVEEVAGEAVGKLEATNPPVFLRFLNLLINDATFMLDEALSYMSKLKIMEGERESWASLPEEQRQDKERDFEHQGDIARSYNILARETIQCLKSLTSFRNPSRILLNSVMVDRLAAMLNYFLRLLVGPEKRQQYRVQDLSAYSFEPKDLVAKICRIYINLGRHDARKDFLLAVCKDKRSYNPQLFPVACDILRRINEPGEFIDGLLQLAEDVKQAEAAENEEDELLMDEEVPDEYLDPIMSHLMRDPVLLPTSGKIVDRSTIARHLLSDQSDPFNRGMLTMDQVKPADELRTEIEAWIQHRRDAKRQSK